MLIDPAKLDQRVQIQAPTVTRDTDGGQLEVWAPFGLERWASVRHLSGNEKRATSHGGQVAEARTEIGMRYLSGVTEQMRVVHRGIAYNIRHVNDLMARREALILTCESEGTNA